jgi:hypothetical protein
MASDTERGRPWEGDLSDEQADGQVVDDSVRQAAELRRLLGEAQLLAEDIVGQHAAEARAFRDGYTLGFEAGRDVGREQVLNEIEAAEAETNRQLSARALDALEHPFAKLQANRYPGRTPEQLTRLRRPA